ncbi:MAG: prefoldin subunit alpha [Candidatus Micrarchaeia archaeon]
MDGEKKNKIEIKEEDLKNLYTYYSTQLYSLLNISQQVQKKIDDIEQSIQTIKGAESAKDFSFISISEDSFLKVKEIGDKFLINIGNEYFQEKTKEEAIELLNDKKKILEENKKKVEESISKLTLVLRELEKMVGENAEEG